MSVNKNRPHIFVLPEDDANRQIVNGFLLEFQTRQIQPLEEAGGCRKVLQSFASDHIVGMEKHPNRLIILLLDFDGKGNRFDTAIAHVPEHLRDRVFILGVTNTTWGHSLLCHNASQIACLRELVQPILFP